MFPFDLRDHSCKRICEVGNTSTYSSFGLNASVVAFHGRAPTTFSPTDNIKNMFDRPVESFTSLLLEGFGEDDDDDQKDENLDVVGEKCQGQVLSLEALVESDDHVNIIQAAGKEEEKDAEMQKLLGDFYDKQKQLVSCQLENIVLKKKTKMAVKKFKSLRKTMKKVLSRRLFRTKVISSRHGGGQEDVAKSSFAVTERHEPAWLSCKVCETRMANMIICPCQHLSVCRRCDETINKCPICKASKISSVEVCLIN